MKKLIPLLPIFVLVISSAGAAPPITLTSQLATYGLSLLKVRGHAVTGATGRLQFDVTDTCHAYAVTQRLTLLIRKEDGSLVRTVSDYDTWESHDGRHFSFLLRNTQDGKTKVESQGTAELSRDGGMVTYSEPTRHFVKLPAHTLFPMAQTVMLLQAAESGRKFMTTPLFDGTSKNGAEDSFIAVLGLSGTKHSTFPPLSRLPSALVDISFFPRVREDNKPDFRSQMRYYTNGVARGVRLDFGNFVMRGRLTHLVIPPPTCQKG